MTKGAQFRVATHNGQTAIFNHRGLVCTMEAGNQSTRDNDAKDIVRCLNSHADLFAALEEMFGWWSTSQIGSTMSAMGQQADYHKTSIAARKAIAAATI